MRDVINTDLYRNFAPGDLLYGLDFARKQISPLIKNKHQAEYVRIDDINSHLVANVTDNDYNYSKERATKFSENITRESIRNYFSFFHAVGLEKVRITHGFPGEKKHLDREGRKTRRCCKAALLKNDCVKHFMLDGINLREVFDLNYSIEIAKAQHKDPHYYNYTSAELRFVFRYWDQIENGQLKFYEKGEEVKNIFEWLHKNQALTYVTDYLASKNISPSNFIIYPGQNQELSLATYLSQAQENSLETAKSAPKTPPRTPPQNNFCSALVNRNLKNTARTRHAVARNRDEGFSKRKRNINEEFDGYKVGNPEKKARTRRDTTPMDTTEYTGPSAPRVRAS